MSRQRMERKKRRRSRNLKRVIYTLLLVMLVIGSYMGYKFYESYQAASETYDDLGREKSDLRDEEVELEKEPFSVLLMGVESYSSDGNATRADTIMLATYNPDKENIKLVSIPRDSRVNIPGYGREKINHSFAYGQEKLTMKTVENLFNVPVDYYATVNFEGFKDIVNIADGIKVDVPFDFEQNSDDEVAEKLQFHEGEMTLNGRYALAYARMRLEDPRGDLGRIDRQQQVIKSLTNQLISPSTIMKLDDIGEAVGNNVKTNIKIKEGINFLRNNKNFASSDIELVNLDVTTDYINGISYVLLDDQNINNVEQELENHLEISSDVSQTASEQ